MSNETYHGIMAFIRTYYDGQHVVYVPHPRESVDEYSYLTPKYSFDLLVLDEPIELYLMRASPLPAVIGGLLSTALLRCYKIIGDVCEYHSFKIPLSWLLSKQDIFSNIYREFEVEVKTDKFKVIPVENG